MEENKTPNLGTKLNTARYKNGEYKQDYVKLTFTRSKLTEIAALAEKYGFRKVGIKLFKVRPHGFPGQELPNRKGIAALIERKIIPEWIAGEGKREAERALAIERAKELGLKVQE